MAPILTNAAPNIAVVCSEGPIDDFYTSQLKDEVRGADSDVIVDMRENSDLSARGLGDLIAMYIDLSRQNRKMTLCNVPLEIRGILGMSMTDTVFDSYWTLEHAIEGISTGTPPPSYDGFGSGIME